MKFLWPDMLWLLAALPALVGAYLIILRRKKAAALRYASLATVKEAMGRGPSMRRHIPPLLLLLGLVALLLSMARPATVITLPSHHETVILAIDVSGSMRAQDVQPSRLAAAQAAALSFVAEQRPSTRVGIVEFSGSAALVQPPTHNREDLQRAIEALQPQNATAIGSGILVSLKALFPGAEIDPMSSMRGNPNAVQAGSYTAAAVIVLTDGQNTVGPDAVEAARIAAERGVRVYTVGIGTEAGEVVQLEGFSMRVALDEATLRAVADVTRAEYFHASSASELKNVYQVLSSRLLLEKQSTEVTALFSAAAALAVVLSSLLSLLWFNRVF